MDSPGEESGANNRALFWDAIFVRLAERFGWTPQQMCALTISQLVHYGEISRVRDQNRSPMTRDEAIVLAKEKRGQREREVEAYQEAWFDES